MPDDAEPHEQRYRYRQRAGDGRTSAYRAVEAGGNEQAEWH
ncbi:MAG TPA: hypothetical protein VF190_02695 [Rhodothermales bacterium]